MEIEEQPEEKLVKIHIDPLLGLQDYQIIQLVTRMRLPREYWGQFTQIAKGLYACYKATDATLVEINPLAIVGQADGSTILQALDGKMALDDNALMKHPKLVELRDTTAEPAMEVQAKAAELNYVKLDGQIGCMVNGAGLAMATTDIVAQLGEADGIMPANFLDVAGGAGADKVAAALKIILADAAVKAILINIFGGITRCDEVARGILKALETVKTELPMVIRLSGTNQEEGLRILAEAHLPNVTVAASFHEAAEKVVAIAKGLK